MSFFPELKKENRAKIFKLIYYGTYNFSPLARVLRTKDEYTRKK